MKTIALLLTASLFLTLPASGAGNKPKPTNPDLTKGEKIPEGMTHDWTLGATGARGWIFSENFATTAARQIAITKVAKGSPADGVLQVGDVILGVGGKPFSYDPRFEFGKALTVAETEAAAGKLVLTRWRAGQTVEVTVKLPVLGSYGATAPYACPKSKRILEQGCAALAQQVADPGYSREPITRSLNALALLASGNPKYLPLVKKEAQWAGSYTNRNMATWNYGYVIMLLAEYKQATGDDSVTPGLRRLALEAANGQSAVGSWGHGFALPDGRLGGYGMMNAPGLPLTIALVLARATGVKDPAMDRAIDRSTKLLRFYVGKGCVPYGDHAPWMESHDDNGKNSAAAVLFDLLDEPTAVDYFAHMGLGAHGAERDCGHTGNFLNILWAVPGIAKAGPQATGAWMQEYGAWYFDLARQWDGTFQHQGPPEAGFDSPPGRDSTGAYLLAYAQPLKKIWLTGARPSATVQLTASEAKQIVRESAGWSQGDKYTFYDKLTDAELLQRLTSWSPVVRERAAIALGRRKAPPVDAVVKLLDDPALDSRLGACQAIEQLRGKAAAAVPALRKGLHADDLWLRIKSADALAAIGKPAMVAVNDLLELMVQPPDPKKDPRGMQQRFLCFALFDRNGLLHHSLDGVEREMLYQAVRAGLKNQDGRSRGSFESVYQNLSPAEIKPLLPAIYQAAIQPAPSGEMFADGIRIAGLRVLAKNGVQEGIQTCMNYARNQNPWGSQDRIVVILDILCQYGAAAKPMIPQLQQLATVLDKGEVDFPRHLTVQKAAAVRATIQKIQAATNSPALIQLN